MRKIKKVKTFANNHYYGICFFAFLMTYLIIVPGDTQPWTVDRVTYCFYAVDFSVGFCSRILQGAICNLLFDTVNETNVTVFLNVLMVGTFALYCFFAEKILLNIEPQYRKTAVLFLLFFFTGPCTFSIFVNIVGLVDFFWVFSVVIFFLIIRKKQLYFLVVPLFVFMVFIYYASLLSYVPFLAIILLYKISNTTEKKERKYLTVVLFVSVIAAVLFGVYFVAFERSNLNYTFEEFNDLLLGRGVNKGSLFYYDYAFYRRLDNDTYSNIDLSVLEVQSSDSLLSFISVIAQQILANFKILEITEVTIMILLLLSPIVVYIYHFIINEIKHEKTNKLRKFSLICILLLFPATILTVIAFFSIDIVRWTTNAYIALFIAFFYVLYKEGNRGWEIIHKEIQSINISLLLPYFLVYAFTAYKPDAG